MRVLTKHPVPLRRVGGPAVTAIAALAALLAVAPAHAAQLYDSGAAVPAAPEPGEARPPVGPALPAPAAPAASPNRLVLEGGGLDLPVGVYGDCTRQTDVGHAGGYIDACIPRPLAYFIGHNPGPFSPLADAAVGRVVDYTDANGRVYRLQLVSSRSWNRFWGAPPPTRGDVVAQFQTCETIDAVWDRILDAVELPQPAPTPLVPSMGSYRTQSS